MNNWKLSHKVYVVLVGHQVGQLGWIDYSYNVPTYCSAISAVPVHSLIVLARDSNAQVNKEGTREESDKRQ